MADSVTVTNMPDSGSQARVAFDMMKYFASFAKLETAGEDRLQRFFNLYEECHNLARGLAGDATKVMK